MEISHPTLGSITKGTILRWIGGGMGQPWHTPGSLHVVTRGEQTASGRWHIWTAPVGEAAAPVTQGGKATWATPEDTARWFERAEVLVLREGGLWEGEPC